MNLLPTGYELRTPTEDELEMVAAVLTADELADAGQITLGADFVRGEWSHAGFDLSTDAWVVADRAGTIVGYAHAVREDPATVFPWGVVHPLHRGRGIGTVLFDRVEDRAARLLAGIPSGRFRHAINAGDLTAAAILQTRGLRPVHHFWHMQIDLTGPCEPGPSPDGVEITGVELPADLAAIHGLLVAAFADDLSHHPEPFDHWAEEQTGSPGYDPTLWLQARA